jgi:hypothetical protein
VSQGFTITEAGDCLLGGRLLHPGVDPLAAAGRELAKLLERAGPEDLLVLAGSGLGWHARAALDKTQGPQVVVYEPHAERRALMAALGPRLAEAEIASDNEALAEALGKRLLYEAKGGRVALFSPPAYGQGAPEVEAAARDILERTRSRAYVDHQTRQSHNRDWLGHLVSNIKQMLEIADATLLAGVLEGSPAVVVGAGPSLDASLADLAAAQGKALIFAAASALGPLAKAGIVPHLAFALEASDESRQFAGANPLRTILAAASSGHPHHFTRWAGPRAVFHLQPWLAGLAGQGHCLPTGGHATSAAFSLALLWGCDPVILVGQDLAYSGGRIHAQHRPGGEDESRPSTTHVPAIGGGEVETSHIMLSYITWYQEAAGFLRARHPERRVVNATAQGARLPGFEHAPLGPSLAALDSLSIDFDVLAGAMARLPHAAAGLLGGRLAQARADLRHTQRVLAEAGWQAAWDAAPADSAARAALQELGPGAGPDRAAEHLTIYMEALSAMAEGLHA